MISPVQYINLLNKMNSTFQNDSIVVLRKHIYFGTSASRLFHNLPPGVRHQFPNSSSDTLVHYPQCNSGSRWLGIAHRTEHDWTIISPHVITRRVLITC